MTPLDIAELDQIEAQVREDDAKTKREDALIQKVATYLLAAFAMVGTYAILVMVGVFPAAPWSMLGQQSSGYDVNQPPPPAEIEIPDGYAPRYQTPAPVTPEPVAPEVEQDGPLLST